MIANAARVVLGLAILAALAVVLAVNAATAHRVGSLRPFILAPVAVALAGFYLSRIVKAIRAQHRSRRTERARAAADRLGVQLGEAPLV